MNEKEQHPTTEEQRQFSIRAVRGIDLAMGKDEPGARVAKTLESKYPGHLILVQSGMFLQGFDRTAYALGMLKKYKMQLVGTAKEPHIRVGFPAGNFKQRLWQVVHEFGIPYVVALGGAGAGRTIYVSDHANTSSQTLSAVSDEIVASVIEDLRQRGELLKASTSQMLASPKGNDFKLKTYARDLDDFLLAEILKMPRDVRASYGDNLRGCMGRILQGVFAYGLCIDKSALLRTISADIDLLKHYLEQAARVKQLKFCGTGAVLAVELGRLTGGLLRTAKVAT